MQKGAGVKGFHIGEGYNNVTKDKIDISYDHKTIMNRKKVAKIGPFANIIIIPS